MSVAFVQVKTGSGNGSSSIALLFDSPVAAGNSILVIISREGSTNRSYSVADTNGGSPDSFSSYFNFTGTNVTKEIEFFYAKNVAGGTTTVTATSSGGDVWSAAAIEVSGLDGTTPQDANVQNIDETVSSTSHVCGNPGLTSSADVIVLACAQSAGSLGTITHPSGYTGITGIRSTAMMSYKVSASAVSGDQASWSSVTSRTVMAAMASFKGPAAAGGVGPLIGPGRLIGPSWLTQSRLIRN